MKKRLSMLLALLLCLAMLCGCSVIPTFPAPSPETSVEPEPEPTPEPTPKPYVPPTSEREGALDVIPFDTMPYERPSLDDLRAAIDEVGAALDNGEDYETVEALLDTVEDVTDLFSTMYAIAFIRSSQDMTDEFYADEYAWIDEASAEVNQMVEKMYFRCGMSAMAQELEEKYFWPGFVEQYSDESNAFYDDEMVALMQEESNLVSEYRAIVASPTVTLNDGTEVDYFTALDEYTGFAYLNLLTCYYNQYNPQLGEIYIKLVKNRQAQAAHAGYDSYEQMAYEHTFERDYSPDEAAAYLADIKKHIVPLYQEVSATGLSWSLDSGSIDDQRLEEVLRYGLQSLGQDVVDVYEFMVKYRLYDITYSPRKAEMSFQIYLDSYEVPFLFMDSQGTLDDVTTFSHEFGHYLDGYLNRDSDETIDLAECYSQAMELLMLTRLDGVLSEWELDNLYKKQMLSVLGMYVQQSAFAEFERIIYSTDPDDLTPDYLNQVFLEQTQTYGFCEAGYESLYSMLWIDITHFFEQPFYVISYPVSHDIAMQIFQLERDQEGAGQEKYLAMLDREYSQILETAEAAGLQSPFAPGRIETVAKTMREILLD